MLTLHEINKKKAPTSKKKSLPKKKTQSNKGAGNYRQKKARVRGRGKANQHCVFVSLEKIFLKNVVSLCLCKQTFLKNIFCLCLCQKTFF